MDGSGLQHLFGESTGKCLTFPETQTAVKLSGIMLKIIPVCFFFYHGPMVGEGKNNRQETQSTANAGGTSESIFLPDKKKGALLDMEVGLSAGNSFYEHLPFLTRQPIFKNHNF